MVPPALSCTIPRSLAHLPARPSPSCIKSSHVGTTRVNTGPLPLCRPENAKYKCRVSTEEKHAHTVCVTPVPAFSWFTDGNTPAHYAARSTVHYRTGHPKNRSWNSRCTKTAADCNHTPARVCGASTYHGTRYSQKGGQQLLRPRHNFKSFSLSAKSSQTNTAARFPKQPCP